MLSMGIQQLADKIAGGGRLDRAEALDLYLQAPTPLLGRLADAVRARKHPDGIVTYIIDRNVNYTNVCVARCNFCAFYRPVGSSEGYVLGFEEIFRKIEETIVLGGTGILMQGGMHPDLRIEYYEELLRAIRERYPIHLHCFSPPEIVVLARISHIGIREAVRRLKQAGLMSIPGGGAEILTDRMRRRISPGKCTAEEWIEVMRIAHQEGVPSTATTTKVAKPLKVNGPRNPVTKNTGRCHRPCSRPSASVAWTGPNARCSRGRAKPRQPASSPSATKNRSATCGRNTVSSI